MLTVAISINASTILARSAVNQCRRNAKGEVMYKVDDGGTVWHRPEDGAVALAKKLLDRINEPPGGKR